MPIIFTLVQLQAVAADLAANPGTKVLSANITVRLAGGEIFIFEGDTTVFHIDVSVIGTNLELDYPRTSDADQQRGWARVGAALALEYGAAMNCLTGTVGTLIEPTGAAARFWGMVQLQPGAPRTLANSLVALNSPAVFVIPDPVVPKGRTRSASFGS